VSIIEQVFRGEKGYIVKDAASLRYFRFGEAEVRVMRAFDGSSDVGAIAQRLAADGMRISARAVEAFVGTLAAAGLLERTVAERSTLQLERLRAERRQRRRPALFRGELLRMRWSFGDPDRLLDRALPYIRWMFTPTFVAASVVLLLVYLVVLVGRWDAFTSAFGATFSLQSLTLGTVVIFYVTSTLVILIHELGHGFACKHFGGEVRELGVMLLYFQPAFYCNVSDAWSFPERRARLWVTAAGAWIELVVASIGALVWWLAEPGTFVATVALTVIVIAGAMTILTNANPLIPLDGYFALSDWLEIPNLRQRAFAHFSWHVKRRLFRIDLPEPAASARERRVFLLYGTLSFAYVTALLTFVAVLVLGWAGRTSGGIGVAIVATVILALLRRAILEWSRTVVLALRTARAKYWQHRRRASRFAFGALAVGALLLLVPCSITAPGRLVVHPLELRAIVAPDSGVAEGIYIGEGARVEARAPVALLVNRSLDAAVFAAARTVDSLAIAEGTVRAAGRSASAARLAVERRSALARLEALALRSDALRLRAPSKGVAVTPRPEMLVGRRFEAGDTLLLLARLDSVEVRVALTGAGATRVEPGQVVHLLSYVDVGNSYSGRVRELSAAGVDGVVEARLLMPATEVWRPGARGEASVEIARSTLAGALWWNLRRRLRVDLWL
jgi:hypothetical protein